jgi:cytochrome c oxidase subunit 4
MSQLASASHQSTQHAQEHGDMLPLYLTVFFTLLFLLVCTWGAYYIPFEKVQVGTFNFGFMNTAIAFAIAITKSSLVILFFMHLRHGTKLIRVVALAGFLWLLIMVLFTFADYISRQMAPTTISAPISTATVDNIEH